MILTLDDNKKSINATKTNVCHSVMKLAMNGNSFVTLAKSAKNYVQLIGNISGTYRLEYYNDVNNQRYLLESVNRETAIEVVLSFFTADGKLQNLTGWEKMSNSNSGCLSFVLAFIIFCWAIAWDSPQPQKEISKIRKDTAGVTKKHVSHLERVDEFDKKLVENK